MRKKPMLTLLSTAVITAVAALSVPTTVVIAAPAKAAAAGKFTNKAYIVRLAEKPVVAYDGGIKGLKATRPGKGQKIDRTVPAVVNYRSFLESRQDAVLASVGGGKKLYSYGYVFNGFAAELTAAQAEKLAATAGVLAVEKDTARPLDTSSTPSFLGLNAPGGLWDQNGGVGSAGENVIIGIVDGGAWPSTPSLSDRTGLNGNGTQGGKLSYQQIPGWNGRCVPGGEFHRQQLQPETDRRAVLQLRLGWKRGHRCAAPLGVQLAARLRRPRHAHRDDGWRQRQRSGHWRSCGIWKHFRYRPASAHCGLQGLLGNRRRRQLLQLGQRGSNRSGRC